MQIGNDHIIGIFNFKSGTKYEVGDLVIYNNLLYYVTKDTDGTAVIPTDPDSSFKEYSLMNAVTDLSEDNSDKLVTAKALRSILNNYVYGLNYDGTLQSKVVTGITDLNDDVNTAVYELTIWKNFDGTNAHLPSPTPTNNSDKFLYRVFRVQRTLTNVNIIQEILDPENGVLYFRSFNPNSTTVNTNWITFNSMNSSNCGANYDQVSTKLNDIYDRYESLYNTVKQCTYVRLLINSGIVSGQAISDNNIYAVEFIVTYRLNSVANGNVKCQEVVLATIPTDQPIFIEKLNFNITFERYGNDYSVELRSNDIIDATLTSSLNIVECIGIKTL